MASFKGLLLKLALFTIGQVLQTANGETVPVGIVVPPPVLPQGGVGD